MTEPLQETTRFLGKRALSLVAGRTALDAPADRLGELLVRSYGPDPDKVRDWLHGVWLGHPLHPLLVAVPIGAVTTTVAMDALGGEQMRDAARFTLGLAIAGSVAAVVTGWNDWQYTTGRARRVGLVHGVLNEVATACYVVSYVQRRRGKRGVAASTLGYAISGSAGYLGGALAYNWGVGVDGTGDHL